MSQRGQTLSTDISGAGGRWWLAPSPGITQKNSVPSLCNGQETALTNRGSDGRKTNPASWISQSDGGDAASVCRAPLGRKGNTSDFRKLCQVKDTPTSGCPSLKGMSGLICGLPFCDRKGLVPATGSPQSNKGEQPQLQESPNLMQNPQALNSSPKADLVRGARACDTPSGLIRA